jgi:hypothetical protein
MKRRSSILFSTIAVFAAAAQLTASARTDTKWHSLYNHTDLSGWHVEGKGAKIEHWKANGEMISCIGPEGGYLATDKEYGDFELKLEYKIPPAANSGVGIRFPKGGWPSIDAMEIQILDDPAEKFKKETPIHRNGAIYAHLAPKAAPGKPAGQWNKMEIHCQGPHVIVKINNVEVQNVNLDEQTVDKGKGKKPLAERPRKGLIGLQSHGDTVDFRKIEVKEL